MPRIRSIAIAALAALSLMGSSAAYAHAELVDSTPAAGAKASGVQTLTLTFSEALVEKLSGVDIVMTGMPGMASHQPMKVTGFTSKLDAGGKRLTLTLPRALPAGSYDAKWHAVTADTHRSEGRYSFSVK